MTNYELLKTFGLSYTEATFVLRTFINETPENANADAAVTKRLVVGVQNFLNDRFSARLVQTGVIDAATAVTLDKIHGPGWQRVRWAAIYDKLRYVAEAWDRLQGEYKPPAILDPTTSSPVVPEPLVDSPTPVRGPLGVSWGYWFIGGALALWASTSRQVRQRR